MEKSLATPEEIAKEIVGKWGYEEPYWWQPIATALKEYANRQPFMLNLTDAQLGIKLVGKYVWLSVFNEQDCKQFIKDLEAYTAQEVAKVAAGKDASILQLSDQGDRLQSALIKTELEHAEYFNISEQLKKENEQLKKLAEWVDESGAHAITCMYSIDITKYDCTCGVDDLLESINF